MLSWAETPDPDRQQDKPAAILGFQSQIDAIDPAMEMKARRDTMIGKTSANAGLAVPAHPKRERIVAFLGSLWIAFLVGNFSYQLYWTHAQSYALYQFARHAKTALVPTPCKEKRGVRGVDFIVISARTYNPKPAYAEACWYPVGRFKALFPVAAGLSEAALIQHYYKLMNFRVRAFDPKPPSRWALFGIPVAVLVVLIGFLVMIAGPKKPAEPEAEVAKEPAVDPIKLATELAVLRRNLER